jgi:hypothetical protein
MNKDKASDFYRCDESDLTVSSRPEPLGSGRGACYFPGGLMGDKAILANMKTSEDGTNTASERAGNHEWLLACTEKVLRRGLADQRRHRVWIHKTLVIL